MRLSASAKNWIVAIAWAGLIFILSTEAFSSENTSRIIVPVLRWLFPHAAAATITLMHAFIRKMAHVTEYFVFSIFLLHLVRRKERGWNLHWAIWVVVIAAGYACLDEFHQVFVPGRHASPWDASLDTAGAAAAQIALWLWYLQRRNELSRK